MTKNAFIGFLTLFFSCYCKESLQMAASFFKILINVSAPHLPLPREFVRRELKDKIPNDIIIRSSQGWYSWRLKLQRIGEMYCFTNGWKKVVKDCKLGRYDFLVFTLVDHSTFKMVMYRPNGCENVLPPKSNIDDGDDVVVLDGDDTADYDPFFISVIAKTHQAMLRLPMEFVGLPGIKDQGTIIMKNLQGEECQMGVRLDKGYWSERYFLSTGWSKFRKSNNLLEGDECVFKFIISEAKLCLAKVTKKEQAATQQAEVVEKRKRGPPASVHGGDDDGVDSEDDCVEIVMQPRGRSPKQKSVM